jgi:hypothetical protein
VSGLVGTLLRTVILDDAAYQEWGERPNLFLRGIVLILVVSLIAGLVIFAVNLVNYVKPVDAAAIEKEVYQAFEVMRQWNPAMQDPEAREMVEGMMDVIVPMVVDVSNIESPLPRGVNGFFQAMGGWLTRTLTAMGGWMLYGALVLIAVNLLGGSAKLPDFLGMVSLYVIPGLLGLLGPIPCLGAILGLIGTIWSIVVYIKAVSVVTDLDGGRAIVAAIAPMVVIALLAFLVGILWIIWLVIIF